MICIDYTKNARHEGIESSVTEDTHLTNKYANSIASYLIIRPRREFFDRLYEKTEKHQAAVMT